MFLRPVQPDVLLHVERSHANRVANPEMRQLPTLDDPVNGGRRDPQTVRDFPDRQETFRTPSRRIFPRSPCYPGVTRGQISARRGER